MPARGFEECSTDARSPTAAVVIVPCRKLASTTTISHLWPLLFHQSSIVIERKQTLSDGKSRVNHRSAAASPQQLGNAPESAASPAAAMPCIVPFPASDHPRNRPYNPRHVREQTDWLAASSFWLFGEIPNVHGRWCIRSVSLLTGRQRPAVHDCGSSL